MIIKQGIVIDNEKARNATVQLIGIVFSFFFLIEDFGLSVVAIVILLTVVEVVLCLPLLKGEIEFSGIHIAFFFIALTIIINIRSLLYIEEQPFYIFSLLMVVFVSLFVQPGIEDRKTLLRIVLFSSFLVSTLVIISRLFPGFFEFILRIRSSSSREYSRLLMSQGYSGAVGKEISSTALYIVVGIPILLGEYYETNRRRFLLYIAILYFALILTSRRTELLAATIAAVIMVFVRVESNKKEMLIVIALFFLLLLFVGFSLISIGAITYSGSNRVINSLFMLADGADISNGRSDLYIKAFNLFKEHPVFGIGWGGFRQYSREILINVSNVHNVVLQLLCETGVVGFLIITSSIAYVTWYSFCLFKRRKNTKLVSIVSFPFFMIVYLLLVSLLDNAFYHDDFWLLCSIIMLCMFRVDETR